MTARPTYALRSRLSRLCRDEDGVILTEFALLLPMMVVVFAVIVEGSRMFWSYQSTIGGVRDATRYLARVLPSDICDSLGASGALPGWEPRLRTIVAQSTSSAAIFPSGVTVGTIAPAWTCHSGSYRGGDAAVAEVTATLTVTFPFAGLFSFFGGISPSVTTTVTDRSRVFGA